MFRTKKNARTAAKHEFSAADRLAALRVKVSPAAQKGAVAAKAYGPVAREKAALAAALATEAAKTYGPIARGRAQAAADWSRPRVEHAMERAQPQLEAARDRAQPHVERAVEVVAPRVQDVVENLGPRVDATRDQIVDEWLPKVSTALATVVAASSAARDQAIEVSDRAPKALSVLKGESVAQPSRRGRSRGKVFIALGVLAAIGAAVAALMNRKPKDDPWAAPLSDSYAAPQSGSTSASRVSDLKDRAAATASAAKERAADVVATAQEKASSVAGAAKEKASSARGATSEPARDDLASGSGSAMADTQTMGPVGGDAQTGSGQTSTGHDSAAHDSSGHDSVGAVPDSSSETGHVVTDDDLDPAEDLDARPNDRS